MPAAGLAGDWSQQGWFRRHREHEPAGEAHPDRTDTWSTALGVRPHGERAQPMFCRVGVVGEDCELSRRTHLHDGPDRFRHGDRLTRTSEQGRQPDRVSLADESPGEVDHAGMDARKLVDHDHGRPRPGAVHVVRARIVGKRQDVGPRQYAISHQVPLGN